MSRPISTAGKQVAISLLILVGTCTLAHAQWKTTKWMVVCPTGQGCEGFDELAVSGLESASNWLSSRFPEPRVNTMPPEDDDYYTEDGNRNAHLREFAGFYMAALVPEGTGGVDEQTGGRYYSDRRLIVIRDDVPYSDDYSDVYVHEIFHGVQYAYTDGSGIEDWIDEGTADAIAEVVTGSSDTERSFDTPLHKPDSKDSAYGTWLFWLALGQELDSSDLTYLNYVLPKAAQGLAGVDLSLEDHGGLYRLLPRVFAAFDPKDERFSSPLEGSTVLEPGQSVAQEPIWNQAAEVAGEAIRWSFKESSRYPVVAELRFEEDHPDLHLIVNGEVYDGEVGGRNVYSKLVDGELELDIVVANVARKATDTKQKEFTLLASLREIKPCDPSEMMSAMDPMAVVIDPETYLRDFAPGGNRSEDNLIQPLSGAIQIGVKEGDEIVVGDGGTICTDPIGTNPLQMETTTGAVLEEAKRQARDYGQFAEKLKGLSPAGELPGQSGSLHPNASGIKGAHEETLKTMSGESDALIQVYSPNAMAWQTGISPVNPLLYDHSGVGNWGANSSANLVIRVLGKTPRQLEVGKTYPAVAVQASPYGNAIPVLEVPTPYSTIYTRWTGFKQAPPQTPEVLAFLAQMRAAGLNDAMMKMYEQARVFEGTTETVFLNGAPVTGSVTITEKLPYGSIGSTVRGSFRLGGSISRYIQRYVFVYDRNGNLDGQKLESETTTGGSLTISGTFSAPAVEVVYRPNRPISHTANVMP